MEILKIVFIIKIQTTYLNQNIHTNNIDTVKIKNHRDIQ